MTNTDEIQAFQTDIQSVPEIKALLDRVAEDAELHELTGGTRLGDPLSAGLSLVVVAALWKLLSVGIAELRRLGEDAALARRIRLIRQLQQMGYERQAPFIIDRLVKELHERPEDDPVLEKLTEIYPG